LRSKLCRYSKSEVRATVRCLLDSSYQYDMDFRQCAIRVMATTPLVRYC
jgi:hypothetical protein